MTHTRQLPLPFTHSPEYVVVDFQAAPSNAEALAWLDRTADWPQHRLALWGPGGCGKTHLLHLWAARASAVLLSGPTLRLAAPELPLAIDDADAAPERMLLHTLNAAAEAALPVLLAGRDPPARWPVRLPDLASRLRAITAVQIQPADDDLLRNLLARLLADRQMQVTEPVQQYLRLHLPRTPAAMREAVARLDRAALAAGGRASRALAAQVVAGMTGAAHSPEDREDFTAPPPPASPSGPRLL
jgi:chromosomal replication initiation ATPase DnaA